MNTFLKIALALLVSTLTLAGCVSTRVSGEKVVVLNERLTSLGFCLQSARFTREYQASDTKEERQLMDKQRRAAVTADQQISAFYPHLAARIPVVFARIGVQSAVAVCPEEGTNVPPELNDFAQILRLTPNKVSCRGTGCISWLDAEAFRRRDGVMIWRGEVSWTAMDGAKFDTELADEVAQKLAIQLQQDGLVPNSKGVTPLASKSSTKGVTKSAGVTHAVPMPPSSGFAAVRDVDAVPKLSPRGKELYLEWLTKPFPRAMALSDKGGFARGYGANAMQQAVQNCEKFSGNPCRLYAVDDQVVWKTE